MKRLVCLLPATVLQFLPCFVATIQAVGLDKSILGKIRRSALTGVAVVATDDQWALMITALNEIIDVVSGDMDSILDASGGVGLRVTDVDD